MAAPVVADKDSFYSYESYGETNPEKPKWSVTDLLAVSVATVSLVWYVTFLWKRRRLYWHASKLPGPFALPFIGSAWYFAGNVHETFTSIMNMFNTYGGIFKVWFGPRLFYAISDPKYMEPILQNCLQKEKLYDLTKILYGEGIFSAPYHKWKPNRKIIASCFNQKILDSFVDVFADQGDVLVEQLKKYTGEGEFDVLHSIDNCTLATICETAMGIKVAAQTEEVGYPKWAERLLEILFFRIFQLFLHNDRIFFSTRVGKEAKELAEKMHSFAGSVVREKKLEFERKLNRQRIDVEYNSDVVKRKVFLDYLLDLTQDAKFTEEQILDEVNTFIVAGSDTTSSTICFTLLTLGLYQDYQDQVYNEIMEVVGEDRQVQASDLPKLKFMERFIKETMRLFPMGGIIVRAVEKDIDLGEHIIPAGVSVVFGILKVHTDETYWPEPYKFDPDRFLPEEVAKRPNCVYLPFSYGPRNCIGLKYAMMAMKSLLVSILRKYIVYTNYKDVQEVQLQQNITLKPKAGFKVYIKYR